MPRGSFLAAPALSTQALLKQFDNNPEVRRRYMAIFGRSEDETRQIISRLSPKELTETHDFPVAFYNESGQWLYREKTLPKGTVVYVTPEGKPFLKEECGNPLVLSLPYPKGQPVTSKLPISVPMSLEQPRVAVVVPPQPSPEWLAPPPGELFPTITVPSPNLANLYAPEGAYELTPMESPGQIAAPGVKESPPFWLALLLPFLFLIGGDHGAGGPPACCSPPVVPETSSYLLFAAGGLGIALVVWRGRPRTTGEST